MTGDTDRMHPSDREAAGSAEPSGIGPEDAPDPAVVGRIRLALLTGVPEAARARHEELLRAAAAGADLRLLGRGRRRRKGRRWAIVAAAAAVLAGLSATAFASNGAVPGDPLYGIDRALERLAEALPRSPEGRVRFRLQLARERLQELRVLAARGRVRHIPEVVAEAARLDTEAAAEAQRVPDAGLRAMVVREINRHVSGLREALSSAPPAAETPLAAIEEAARRVVSSADRPRRRGAASVSGKRNPPESPAATDTPRPHRSRGDSSKRATPEPEPSPAPSPTPTPSPSPSSPSPSPSPPGSPSPSGEPSASSADG